MKPGHLGCPGCGAAIAIKFALKALGEKIIMVIPASCASIIVGPYPQSALNIPILHTAFATAGAAASGVRAALDMKGDTETTVLSWAGDGGTFDIGFQSLSGAVERNEDCIFVCYDNEAYMNTGVQRSSATPYGVRTTTTPGQDWKRTRKKKYYGNHGGPSDSLRGYGQHCLSGGHDCQVPKGQRKKGGGAIYSYFCFLCHRMGSALRHVR